jgi:hypothetical protein
MRGHSAMKINKRLDGFFCDLEARQFSQQHVLVLEDQGDGEMNIKLSHAYQGQQPKRAPAPGTQSSHEDVGIENNLRCSHLSMVNRAASEGNVLSGQRKSNDFLWTDGLACFHLP